MNNLFKDAFTGRVVESIAKTVDHKGERCYEFSFLGTEKKLQIFNNLKAAVWVDYNKTDTIFQPEIN